MLLLIYLKISVVLAIIIFCGITLFRRATEEKRAEVAIPSGVVIGIALYIFLLNAVAYFLKGLPGFYLALAIELALALVVRKFVKAEPLQYPTGKLRKAWLISLSVWIIFLNVITSTGHALSGDASTHYILASLFIRGDFPIHAPFQPDFIAYYHFGAAELLGAFKAITGASFLLLFSLFSFISLLVITQILTFIIRPKLEKKYSIILSFLIPAVGIITLGQFVIAWPFLWELPDIRGNVVTWIGQLPTFGAFGASTSLDNFSLFIHRMLTIAFFAGLLPLILYPKNRSYILPALLIGLTLASTALTDESVFLIFAPAILIFTFFYHFKRSLIKWVIFCLTVAVLIVAQGGFITESLFDQNKKSQVLIFPKDETGVSASYGQYRSYRLALMKSTSFADRPSYHPFRFLAPGILWQLGALFGVSLITLYIQVFRNKAKDVTLTKVLILLFSSAVSSLIAFHAFVPKGYYHLNGSRLLGLAFHLSGLGIAFFIIYWWTSDRIKIPLLNFINVIAKAILIWILFASIIIPLMQLFPRQKVNWFNNVTQDSSLYSWIRNNIPVNKRIIMLTESFPSSGSNTDLVTNVGTLTPVWTSEYLATGFDTNPMYSDVFYTLNPELLKILKMNYIVIGDLYLSQLSKISPKRILDLKNPDFFQSIVWDHASRSEILRVLPKYLSEGENLHGTFYELRNTAPKSGKYFMEGYPAIEFGFQRSAQLTLYDREVYYDINKAPWYAFVIDVDLKNYGDHQGAYDYLILGKDTDPKTICNCNSKLIWEGLGTGIKFWKAI